MTHPEVDQELERLFSVTRAATLPDAGARERVYAGLAPRLGALPPPRVGRWRWLTAGIAAIGVFGVVGAFWVANTKTAPTPPSAVAPPPARAQPIAPSLPVAVPQVEAPPPLASSAPRAMKAPHRPAPSPASAAPEANAGAGDELALVRQMQQALRSGDGPGALTLAAEHARRFPRGALVEEREGVRAVARCSGAAPAERAALAESFTRRFGGSPYAARVKAACQ